MEKKMENDKYYRKLYEYVIREYSQKYLSNSQLGIIKKKKRNKMRCPICNFKNSIFNQFCKNCSVDLHYSLDSY